MHIKNTINPEVLSAATGMLQTYIPELSPRYLVTALKAYDPEELTVVRQRRPLTRKEAATLMSVSIPTVNRYLKSGELKKIKMGKRLVRITPESIELFMCLAVEPKNNNPV